MRLLHTTDLAFKDFLGEDVPSYAIISHRWSNEEVSYHDFIQASQAFFDLKLGGYGWIKIARACRIARQRELEWIWMDTCCIDKSSSSELSEAINSMFKWYQQSRECYVFLPDLSSADKAESLEPDLLEEDALFRGSDFHGQYNASYRISDFKSSTWFTRAWTLQELLAPGRVLFFDSEFVCFGSRNKLADLISQASSIPTSYLVTDVPGLRGRPVESASVAERLRWASRRQATRPEDIAYSLLGLFSVNMPLLYGEGHKAFLRLQTEIIKISNDESIFVWWSSNPKSDVGLLATSIENFSQTQDVRPWPGFISHYEVTNSGIRMTLMLHGKSLRKVTKRSGKIPILLPLRCEFGTLGHPVPTLIIQANMPNGYFERITAVNAYRSDLILINSHYAENGDIVVQSVNWQQDDSLDSSWDLVAGRTVQGHRDQIEVTFYIETGWHM